MKLLRTKYLLMMFLSSLMLAACEPEDDFNNGYDDDRDKFAGTWRFTEDEALKSSLGISYSVAISNDPGNSAQVRLKNFGNIGQSYYAEGIVTDRRITVPAQEMAQGFLISGSGTLSTKGVMTWEYTITAGGDMIKYNATAVRQ